MQLPILTFITPKMKKKTLFIFLSLFFFRIQFGFFFIILPYMIFEVDKRKKENDKYCFYDFSSCCLSCHALITQNVVMSVKALFYNNE